MLYRRRFHDTFDRMGCAAGLPGGGGHFHWWRLCARYDILLKKSARIIHPPQVNIDRNQNMTKRDMVLRIANRMRMQETDVRCVVQMTLESITEVLATEGRTELRNLGVYEVKTRKPRKARNPKTGEQVMVPSRKVVTFKAGKFMEDRVNGLVGSLESGAVSDDEEAPAVDERKAQV